VYRVLFSPSANLHDIGLPAIILNMPSYISHLHMMYKLAKKTGIDKHVFNAVYVVEFQSVTKNFPRECFDFLHYATERMVWERFCKSSQCCSFLTDIKIDSSHCFDF